MPINSMSFQGINRAISDYANAGACEELINIRPTGTGLVPVKPFNVKMQGATYDRIFVHKTGTTINYLAVKKEGTSVRFYRISESGDIIGNELASFSISGLSHFSVEQVYFAYTGNVINFSVVDKEDAFYKNISFIYKGNAYEEYSIGVPEITMETRIDHWEIASTDAYPVEEESTTESMKRLPEILASLPNMNKNVCYGPTVIAMAFRTTSGDLFWTGNWMVYNPVNDIIRDAYIDIPYKAVVYRNTAYPESAGGGTYGDWFASLFNTYDVPLFEFVSPSPCFAKIYGPQLYLELSMDTSQWSENDSIIESIEIYASQPEFIYDPAIIYSGKNGLDPSKYYAYGTVVLPLRDYKSELNLENRLLYLQKSIPMTDIVANGGTFSFNMEFGGAEQVSNKVMEVDSGRTERFGQMLAFNSRFHFYNSLSKRELIIPHFSTNEYGETLTDAKVFVEYLEGGENKVALAGTAEVINSQGATPRVDYIIASSTAIKRVILVYRMLDIGLTPAKYQYYTYFYDMYESKKYNYVIHAGSFDDSDYREVNYEVNYEGGEYHPYSDKWDDEPIQFIVEEEPNAINVSEQYEPFVFKPEHSYLAPGKVIELQPQYVAVKDVTYGDYPLNVFTDRGLYALLQGSGSVLYGATRAVSNLVCIPGSKCVPTENGTFFLSSGGLWLIAGTSTVLVSDALSLGPHTFIRNSINNPQYGAICNSNTVYNIKPYESTVPFEQYVVGAKLSYNRFRDEIIVSNPSKEYSYVLSLKYRQWFKIGNVGFQESVGDNIWVKKSNVCGTAEYSVSTSGVTPPLIANVYIVKLKYGTEAEIVIENTMSSGSLATQIEETLNGYQRWAGTTAEIVSGTKRKLILNLPSNKFSESDLELLNGSIASYNYDTRIDSEYIDFSMAMHVEDFTDEVQYPGYILLHLQTRPFSLGFQYSHIHRVVSMIRTALAGSQNLVLHLYGSDDLQTWKLLSYASRDHAKISQIRTAPAARSWRYYTICIGGKVGADTDFGPTLYEYEPVVRRIG